VVEAEEKGNISHAVSKGAEHVSKEEVSKLDGEEWR
jgi:hypothetical protein